MVAAPSVEPLLVYAVVLLTAALVCAALAAYAWRRRSAPGAKPLAGMLLGMVCWAGFYGAGLLTHDLQLRILWLRCNWTGSGFVPAFWLLFALEYAGLERYRTRRTVSALLSVPVVTVLLAWTSDFHDLMWQSPRVDPRGPVTVLRYEDGLWYSVFDVYTYLVIGVATVVIAGMVVRHRDMYTDQAVALIVGSFMPAVGYGVVLLGFVRPGIDPTPLTFPVTGLTFGYVIFRGDLFERLSTTGEVGRDAAVDTMQDAVVVVDPEGRVVDANPAARRALGAADPAGEPVAALVSGDLPALDGTERTAEVASADGTREFEVSVSPVEDVHGRVSGHSLVFRDVTERKQYRERLQVANRVLRHNLRNDMTVVIGHAQQIAALGEGRVVDSAETIVRNARELSTTGQKLREVESLLEDASPGPVALASLVEDAVGEIREDHPEADVSVAVDPAATERRATALPGIGTAVRELVENGIVHQDRETPRVRVRVGVESGDGNRDGDRGATGASDDGDHDRRGDDPTGDPGGNRTDDPGGDRDPGRGGDRTDELVVEVADDGPGIPDHEQEVLSAETETALKHGSGAGLWVAKWLVDRSGGSLDFESGPDGTTVAVRLAVAGESREHRPPGPSPDRGPESDAGPEAGPRREESTGGDGNGVADADGVPRRT